MYKTYFVEFAYQPLYVAVGRRFTFNISKINYIINLLFVFDAVCHWISKYHISCVILYNIECGTCAIDKWQLYLESTKSNNRTEIKQKKSNFIYLARCFFFLVDQNLQLLHRNWKTRRTKTIDIYHLIEILFGIDVSINETHKWFHNIAYVLIAWYLEICALTTAST